MTIKDELIAFFRNKTHLARLTISETREVLEALEAEGYQIVKKVEAVVEPLPAPVAPVTPPPVAVAPAPAATGTATA